MCYAMEAERGGRGGGPGARSMDQNFAEHISRQKKWKGVSADDEYDYDEGVEMHDSRGGRQTEAKRQKREKSEAAA